MARNEFRIPIEDVVMPAFASSADRTDWLAKHKVSEAPDHMGRPSISVTDAYRLRDIAERNRVVSEAKRQAAEHADAERIRQAQARRQKVFSDAFLAAGNLTHPRDREAAAHAALVEAEQGLSRDVSSRLTPALWPISRSDAFGMHVQARNAASNGVAS